MHKRVYSGGVVWCAVCACLSDSKAKGMAKLCNGAPKKSHDGGGMWGQMRKLLRRCHPKTLQLMQEHRNADGSLWVPSGGTYERLVMRSALVEAVAAHVIPDGFYPYVSDDFIGQWRRAAWKPDHSTETRPTVEECSLARLQKVRNKEKLNPPGPPNCDLRARVPQER